MKNEKARCAIGLFVDSCERQGWFNHTQSCLMSSRLMMSSQRLYSAMTNWSACDVEFFMGSSPSFSSAIRVSGSSRACCKSAFRRAITGAGVLPGAAKILQKLALGVGDAVWRCSPLHWLLRFVRLGDGWTGLRLHIRPLARLGPTGLL